MTPLEDQARAIFFAVLERPADQWSAALDAACGDNAALRARVEQLLHSHQAQGSIHAAAATIDAPATSEFAGTVIGSYKLIEPIGEGGMGTVWMAQQTEPVKRLVAIKLIKAGMDSKQVIARFDAERQALALMDHPNIARVLDGGQTPPAYAGGSPRPYFVMDLVKGVPITKYCDEHRLTPRQRLELFVPVCQAIQHAHQKGIIHRDLKPSNVLVAQYDGRPVPKVIDFGVAKAAGQSLTDKTLVTGFGNIVGTLEYMSPEQAEVNQLDIDTRSDIYSLGVLLYELLAGSPPFSRKELEKAGMLEMLRVIREQEPSKPSTKLSSSDALPTLSANRGIEPAKLARLVRGELDWIVMKALDKDRGRRYETANGFAIDVQRYLAGEPVLAAPASAMYRLRKLARRHRGPVIAASLVLLALVAGVIGTTVGMLQAKQATKDALEQKHLAEQAAEQEREAKVREARRADGEQKAKVQAEQNLAFAKKGNEILGSVFAGLDPKQIAESGRPLQDVLRQNLGKAVKELESSAIGDPLEVAEMQNVLGGSLWALGEYALAVEVFDKALKTRQAKLGPDDPDTLMSMNNLGLAYADSGKLDKALPLYEETLRLMKAKLGPDHPDSLTGMHNLAGGYLATGKLDKALPLYEESLKLREAKLGLDHPLTLTTMSALANGYLAAGQLDKALPLLEETLKRMKAKLGPDHPETLACMNILGLGYRAADKLDVALPLFEETLKLKKAKLGPDHPATLASMNNLASGYQFAGKLDKALPLFEETLKLVKAKLGPDHPDTLMSMSNLALAYQAAGQLDKALPLLEATLKLRKAKLGPDHPHTLNSLANLAVGYQFAGKLDKALPLFEETLKLQEAKLGPDHPDTLGSMNNLASAYRVAGQLDKALPLYEESLKLTKAKLGPDHRDTLDSMNNLAVAYEKSGQLDKALPLQEETLKLMKAKLGLDHPGTLTSMNNLAVVYEHLKRLDQSIPLFEMTLQLMEKKLGRQHPDTLTTLGNLGVNYMYAGRLKEAIALLEEAYQASRKHPRLSWYGAQLADAYTKAGETAKLAALLREQLVEAQKTLPKDSPQLAGALAQIGLRLLEQKKWAEAEPLLRECVTIREKTQPDTWSTFNAQSMLGGSLLGQKKYAEAEPLLLKGYEGMKSREKTIPKQGELRIPEALDRLIELYTATDKPDEAKKWRAERAKYPDAKKK
jgi:serine/threonine protein kinase/tetratricopeptide (TPR) repeat protein